ncbi:unnamed protein product [Periconia digitata]|uniref:Uncharacterized protein n=1 Tax=Periconia digitata TaxID=1303443 RepID=A0A9W4XTK4_9PLEO|nr:unnamed protein product [Periconia digitata]
MDPRNKLLISKEFEELLGSAQIATVPADNGSIDPETGKQVILDEASGGMVLKVVVLDMSFTGLPTLPRGNVLNKNLDGRILEFQNDFRPWMRYLRYLALSNIARRLRLDVPTGGMFGLAWAQRCGAHLENG